ncbi:MAG: dienelactone hydrolase family protein [Xanthobacteraceae bacterium]|nr:MAG: dienelactone hydrolase family protein [Xanthobacteraceae bacterium]
MGGRITFKRPDGKDTEGYFARAGGARAPGVVVIQEWWGLQSQITGICDRLAMAGYDALAPDLYAGTVVPYHDREAASREMSSLDFLDATDQIVRGAARHLRKTAAKVGLTGFCLGGAVAMLGACRIAELDAAVVFYGLPPASAAKPADVRVPLQGHFANTDDWCTPAVIDALEAGLKAAGKNAEIFRYDAAHAFMNEQRQEVHDRLAAELAWSRMLAFWKTHLAQT